MASVTKRLLKELQNIQREPPHDDIITLGPTSDENILQWRAVLRGPSDTPYYGGAFELRISISDQYPIQPPTLTFVTPVCHPNVNFGTGEICLDILKSRWSPAWTLASTCLAVHLLLSDPEPSSPLNCDAANLLRCGDTVGYNSLVSFYTRMYALE
ncbi:E2 ubiquitin-protein ligase peroxin 4 [Coemansia spiralis]|uniref:E2 ubiquitin-protein ligase peroxin 4 n=2 Tax=Coemansia TaxID=4863 RepID=A0A9W8G8P6_9FUNG|nr:ubiquitin-conjugating enzyme/RWD-like protein [Coemansia spiralis]KAJ1987089.1 E2 ubiquitin-protein ligase peroxin 4 [Coemansia umbellata]KAJ2621668.1 E2 ubiquitin-protein ligase peroxin 4 [Coemansia sp. RSA 1358]KAJ2676815.1 E2 ubiquitin-protein ligase peroxin 4 [Coemansia spiralis]